MDDDRFEEGSVGVLRTFFKGLSKSYAFSPSHFHDDFLFYFIRNTCGFFLLYVIQKMIYLAVSLQRLLKKKGRNAMVLLPLDRVLDIPRLSPIADNREKGDHKNAF